MPIVNRSIVIMMTGRVLYTTAKGIVDQTALYMPLKMRMASAHTINVTSFCDLCLLNEYKEDSVSCSSFSQCSNMVIFALPEEQYCDVCNKSNYGNCTGNEDVFGPYHKPRM